MSAPWTLSPNRGVPSASPQAKAAQAQAIAADVAEFQRNGGKIERPRDTRTVGEIIRAEFRRKGRKDFDIRRKK